MAQHQITLFGDAIGDPESIEVKPGPKHKPPQRHGYAGRPGTGPEGETCKTCLFHYRKQMANTYSKCWLVRQYWTGGAGTDILVRSPACNNWLPKTLPAISIRPPWPHYIMARFKDVENRIWPLPKKFIGKWVFIHASKRFDHEGYQFILQRFPKIKHYSPKEYCSGGIVGVARFTGCVTDSDSPWFFGPYGWLIERATVLPFMRCNGQQNFFQLTHN